MLKQFFLILHFSSVFLAALTFLFVKTLVHNSSLSAYPYFLFFAVLGIYGAHRIFKFHFDKLLSAQMDCLQRYYILFTMVCVFSLFTSLYFLFQLVAFSDVILFILVLTLLTGLYIFPKPTFSLRRIPRIKAFLVAMVWTFLVYYIPIGYESNIGMFTAYFCFFLHLSIVSDIKDLDIDSSTLRTMPMEYGIRGSYAFSLLLVSCFYGVLWCFSFHPMVLCCYAGQLLFLYVFYKQKKENSQFYDYSIGFLIVLHYLTQI